MKKIISLFTFFVISSAVFYGAGFTLDKCLTDHPNTEVVASLFNRQQPGIAQIDQSPAILGASTEDQTPAVNTTIEAEVHPVCTQIQFSGNSVINYLMSREMNYSFDYREALASSYGITNYQGDSNQNQQLLKNLIQSQAQQCVDSN